ncbi:MAG TPA: PDZ domain-containing protein, partial [Lacipirellulaceae bacterium]|nr:PDZ domain-containing protein [Lacipirellulaceae bacterium]
RSTDSDLSLAALEHLATLKNRPAESAMAAEKLADVREQAAMEALVELGARVEYDQPALGFAGPTPTLKVVIGPTWTGGVDGLSHIGAVRRATTASFYSASIKGDEAAPRLETITHLQTIEFYGTKVSDAAVERLRGALPHANVDVRGPARLGIAGSPLAGGGGAAVNEVQAGTAAEKAGIVPGDVITEIEGTPVTDFKMLTREIAKAKAGDTITLKVLRQPPVAGQPALPIDVKVQFARWGDEQAVNPTAPSPMGGRPLGAPTRVYMERR